MDWIDRMAHEAPLALIALVLLGSLLLSWEMGARTSRRSRVAGAGDADGQGHVLTAVLGLLALLIAFTFGLALERHEVRRALVVEEANALGTAYLRTDLLSAPERLRSLMRTYAQERLVFGRTAGSEQAASVARAERLQAAIWREAVASTAPKRGTAVDMLVLAPINEAIDLAAARKAAVDARVPATVLASLWAYALVSAAIMGRVVGGRERRHRTACSVLFILLTLAALLILDLDRPRAGAIRTPQTPMLDAAAAMTP